MSDAVSPLTPPEHSPGASHVEHIGPYRVLQVLGQGGMGVVYEAEQTTPVHRRVALKVVRAGFETHDIIARFESERQALAVMSHESIAKVLDAGASDSGRPYFVMELVRGVPITEYCDSRKLSIRERVELFVPVCQGVQHAHQKGVIHRDLKPSNVLVTEVDGRPLPKIIDFGIAKAAGQRLTDHTLVTMVGQTMGTPAYMSPEQAEMSGLDVDTRTDVYSLGVMLYELLVGRLPEDPAETGLPAFLMRLSMRETDPPTPSAKLTTLEQARGALASLRSTDGDALRRQLRGDLDCVVMTALEKDRNRRYATAGAMATDLTNYLTDLPVLARPASAGYRMRKFVRRHRVGAMAGTAVGLALLVGAAAAATGFVRATRANALALQEAATAREVSSFLVGLFNVSAPDRARGNAITARQILDSGAVRLRTELADQPAVQAYLMNTIGSVYAQLGQYPEAESLLVAALATRERLAEPAALATSLTSLGVLYRSQGRYEPADSLIVRAVSLAEPLGDTHPAYLASLQELAELHRVRGSYDQADSLGRLHVALLERSAGPDSRELYAAMSGLASLQAERGQPAAAESLFRRIHAYNLRTSGPDGLSTAAGMSNLASTLYELGSFDEADSLYRQALAIETRSLGPEHPKVAMNLYNIANVENERARYEEAIDLYGRAQAIWERDFGPDHPYVGAALTASASVYSQLGRHEQAVPLLRRAITIREKTLEPGHAFIATSYHQLGVTETKLKRFAEAERHLATALELRERALDPGSAYTTQAMESLAELYRDSGRRAEAVAMYERVIARWEASDRDDREEQLARARKSYDALRTGAAGGAAPSDSGR